MIELLLWGTDWLNKTVVYNPADNATVVEVYVLVGDPDFDHGNWERPETIVKGSLRPTFKLTSKKGGTDCAAEYSAAFAAASLCYRRAVAIKKFDRGMPYVNLMIKNAEAVMKFADKDAGKISIISIIHLIFSKLKTAKLKCSNLIG
jgi:hypothetical protein